MDDFKRCYSNEDEAKSIPYFWEKFDKDNYSIWYGEYKYPEELKKVYMSCNLITGMNDTNKTNEGTGHKLCILIVFKTCVRGQN